jgi:hypoxanthine phosphoribosyltransferase
MNPHTAQTLLNQSEELISEADLHAAICRLAEHLTEAVGTRFPLMLSIAHSGLVFTGLLLPRLAFPLQFDQLQISHRTHSHTEQSSGWRVTTRAHVKGRVVVVLDDILDDGETMSAVRQRILDMGAAQCLAVVLCDKRNAQTEARQADFSAVQLPDERHVFGSGMDIRGYWRNLPGIWAQKPQH